AVHQGGEGDRSVKVTSLASEDASVMSRTDPPAGAAGETASAGVDATAGCVVVWVPSREMCGREVVLRGTVGCEHEHLEDIAVCQFHIEELAYGELWCTPCYDAEHVCPITLLAEIEQAGERVVLRE